MATEREAYLCLSAMLRAREPKLLNTEKSIRMLEAPSFEDAAKVLTDCGYADMSQMSAREIEASLNERRNAIFAELDNMSPQKELVDVFRMKYDYHNAKAIIKAEAMDTDATHLLSGSGRIDGEKLLSLYTMTCPECSKRRSSTQRTSLPAPIIPSLPTLFLTKLILPRYAMRRRTSEAAFSMDTQIS